MSWRPHGRFTVDPSSPQARGVCDRCGAHYQLNQLRWQMQWAGARLQNLRILVCRSCTDRPQEQLRSIIIPADPVPVMNPRPEGPTGYANILPDFSAWTESAVTLTPNVAEAPDGSMTAWSMIEDTATSAHYAYIRGPDLGLTVGDVATLSVFAKAAGRNELDIYNDNVYVALDAENPYGLTSYTTEVTSYTGRLLYGSAYVAGSAFWNNQGIVPTTVEATNVGDGWWWLGFSFVVQSDIWNIEIYLNDVFGVGYSYTGDGTSGVYLWKPQLVAGYSNVFPGPSNVETNE